MRLHISGILKEASKSIAVHNCHVSPKPPNCYPLTQSISLEFPVNQLSGWGVEMRLPAEVIHRSQVDFFPLYIMFAELNLQNKYIF